MLAGLAAAQSGKPTFRVTTDLVAIDVSVRRGNAPVMGLQASDFELRDNGVQQKIDAVSIESVPGS
jgi:hypothetical protein